MRNGSNLRGHWYTVVAGALSLVLVGRLILTAVAVMPIGWLRYDDEGYFLITVQGVLDGRPLYDETYSQYGPAYYLTEIAVRRLTGIPVTHDTGRAAIVGVWLAVCSITAWWVRRLTSSLAWATVAFAVVGGYVLPRSVNPGLPQWFLLLLVTGLIGLASLAEQRRVLAVMGAVLAALALTKINSGVYLTVAVGLALLASIPPRRWTAAAYVAATLLAMALPFVVMRRDLAAGHLAHPLSVSLAIAGCTVAAWRTPRQGTLKASDLGLVLAGFAGTTVAICGAMLLTGTTPAGLLNGVVLWPARLAYDIWMPQPWSWTVVALGVVSLLACERLSRGHSSAVIVTAMRVMVALLALASWFFARDYFITCGAAFVWVILLPASTNASPRWASPRRVLAFAAALHTLYAYPVPGYQVAWAAFLLISVAIVCLADVAAAASRVCTGAGRALEVAALGGLLVNGPPATLGHVRDLLVPLDLPGARQVLVSPDQAAQLRWLTEQLRSRCDTFVTNPGLNSLYFWTGLKPPTGLNAGAWMILLDAEQQQRVVTALESSPRPCVVRNVKDAMFWLRGRDPASPDPATMPLARYIEKRFATVATMGGYELRMPIDEAR